MLDLDYGFSCFVALLCFVTTYSQTTRKKHTNIQTYKETHVQASRQANKQPIKQNKQASEQTHKQTYQKHHETKHIEIITKLNEQYPSCAQNILAVYHSCVQTRHLNLRQGPEIKRSRGGVDKGGG